MSSENARISYADTLADAVVGCVGCELWSPKSNVRSCYAGRVVEKFSGLIGFPERFERPRFYRFRFDEIFGMSDLTGQARSDKWWLSGFPRVVAINDMGDTFTPGLPIDWLDEYLELIRRSPHQFVFSTKFTERMSRYFSDKDIPENLWIGVGVTSKNTIHRAAALPKNTTFGVRWISFEPLLGPISLPDVDFNWAVISGAHGMPAITKRAWITDLVSQLDERGIPVFFRQYGNFSANPYKHDMRARENRGPDFGGSMLYQGEYRFRLPKKEACYDA